MENKKLKNRRALIDMLDGLNYEVAVEVGVSTGQFSKYILENTKLKLYSVDPWEDNAELSNADVVYKFATDLLKPYGEKSIMVKGYSPEVCDQFDDDSIDFLYIDGLHDYDSVKSDIEGWYDKVKTNGIISGHDYSEKDWIGVVNAVNEFVEKNNLTLNITGTDGIGAIIPSAGRAKEVQTGSNGEFDGHQASWWFYKK